MKLFIVVLGFIAGTSGIAAVLFASHIVVLNGWGGAPEGVLLAAVGAAASILGFKTIVWAVLKLNHF